MQLRTEELRRDGFATGACAAHLQNDIGVVLDFIAGFPDWYVVAVAERLPAHIRAEIERIASSNDEMSKELGEESSSPLLRIMHDDARRCLNQMLAGKSAPTAATFFERELSRTAERVEVDYRSAGNVIALSSKG